MTAHNDPSTPDPQTRTHGRATTYRGIRMRSRLEAHFAQVLDSRGVPWEYEPQCFADVTGQYLPDFAVPGDYGRRRYIDVKPDNFTDAAAVKLKRQMEIIWSTDPRAELEIAWRKYGQDDSILSWSAAEGGEWEEVSSAQLKLVALVCGCGHSIAGLPTENLPCWICQYGNTPPFGDVPEHRCTLTAVA